VLRADMVKGASLRKQHVEAGHDNLLPAMRIPGSTAEDLHVRLATRTRPSARVAVAA
jgi:hypothetical protein